MTARKASLKQLLIHLAIILGVFFALLLGFFYLFLPIYTNHGESVTVPNVVGMSNDEAENFLVERNFRHEILIDSAYSEDYPPYTVLLQDPQAEQQVKEGRKIYLTLNMSNPPNVKMPGLLTTSFRNAKLQLESAGLNVGKLTYQPDPAVGTILAQEYNGRAIRQGDNVPKGSYIDLVIGDGFGNRDFKMPNVLGLLLDEALFTISGSEFQLGDIEYVEDSLAGPGEVVRQHPIPATGVRIGDKVNLWVVEGMPLDSLNMLDSLNAQWP